MLKRIKDNLTPASRENGGGRRELHPPRHGSEANNIQTASATNRYPDEYTDEDYDNHYSPGMGMGYANPSVRRNASPAAGGESAA